MQRFLFLFFVLFLGACQNTEQTKFDYQLAHLIHNYEKIPEQYQRLELEDLLLLDPIAQKIKLKQGMEESKLLQRFDSLCFDFLGKPFLGFIETIYSPSNIVGNIGYSTEILIRIKGSWSSHEDIYYVSKNEALYKRITTDSSCDPSVNAKPSISNCFRMLTQKAISTNSDDYAALERYLNECNFSGFPLRFNNSCFDGEKLMVCVKNKDSYKVIYTNCPREKHPISIILKKVEALFAI